MNKKGFTLIELLAVIIILAIIALIAVPVILNIIDVSKKKALENTAYGMIRAGELYNSENLLKGNNINRTFDGPNYTDLSFKGEKVNNGSVTVNKNGKVSIWLYKDGYCVYKKEDDNEVTLKENVESSMDCSLEVSGKSVCTLKNGVEYTCDLGDGKERTFYYLGENEDGTVSLIMDRNIGGNVAWVSKEDYIADGGSEAGYSNDRGPLTANKYLNKVTSNWNKDIKVSLPTYFHIFNVNNSQNLNNTPWLYANLNCDVNNCTEPVENDTAEAGKTYAYWISTKERDYDEAIDVDYGGDIYIAALYCGGRGVRPVITMEKSKLK